jgi:hypothetical protein
MAVKPHVSLRILPAAAMLGLVLVGGNPQLHGAEDADAGTWKMIVLTGPEQFPVPAPAPVTDAGYRSEFPLRVRKPT